MRLKSASIFLSAIVAVALVGCQSAADPLVGTWVADMDLSGMKGTMEATYGADKSFKMNGQLKNEMMEMDMTQTGTWEKVEGDKVKITLTNVDVKAGGPNAAQIQPMLDQQKGKMLEDANKAPATAITFEGNDKITQSVQGQTLTFNRKK